MSKRFLLGMLTPSSNTSLEPVTNAMLNGLPGVSAHFSRFSVTEISLGEKATGQFDIGKILEAAKLLADARVDVIGWSGTAASWLGFDTDERLCAQIAEATGIPATTSVLALNEILQKQGCRSLGLVSPYVKPVQDKIVANYASIGIDVTGERHLGLQDNFSFSEVTEQQIEEMACDVSSSKPDAITVMCTNIRAAQLAPKLEDSLGIPFYDSVSTVVWKSLSMAGYDVEAVRNWGSLFQEVR